VELISILITSASLPKGLCTLFNIISKSLAIPSEERVRPERSVYKGKVSNLYSSPSQSRVEQRARDLTRLKERGGLL
jgi:hypothetical protein